MAAKTTLFDDAELAKARNEGPALAQVYKRIVTALNAFAARPMPFANRIGGTANYSDQNTNPSFRLNWYPPFAGAPAIVGVAGIVPIANATSVPMTGLILNHFESSQVFSQKVVQTAGRKEDQNADPEIWYPQFLQVAKLFEQHVSDYAGSPQTARAIHVQSGESGFFYGPQIRSLLLMTRLIEAKNVDTVAHPVIGKEALPLEQFALGSEIWGDANDYRSIKALRDFATMLYRSKRIQCSFNMVPNATGTQGASFGSGGYGYLLNPEYGVGGGAITPTVTGPGIRMPLRCAAQGNKTTVRIYIRVYARMAGGGTGGLAVYSRDNSGGLSGPTAVTNGPTVSGTTWQWYPNTTAFNPATDPYFLGNANTAYASDVLVPMAGGTGGSMECSAFTLRVYPSDL